MSSKIKKSFFFPTKQACLFYYCELPLGYRIIKNGHSQEMGEFVCIFSETEQVFTGKLTSIPHINLNIREEWNEATFSKLFKGMENFIFQEAEIDDGDVIQLESSSVGSTKKNSAASVKNLLVRDPTNLKEQVYLLRCPLNRIGPNRLWQQFEKYNRFMRREAGVHQNIIKQLQQKKQQKYIQINKLISAEERKKNLLKEKLTLLWREKQKKYKQLNPNDTKSLLDFIKENQRYDDESSMNISDLSNIDVVSSQDDRQLVGSIFEPSQNYYYRQRIREQNNIDDNSEEHIQQK